jgi:hypothetical protein
VNHDALFKMLLKRPAILRGFFEAFLPKVASFIDFACLEFVDKERVTADGKKRTGDLLVKTRFRDNPAAFPIHLEHQAQHESDIARRMLEYWLLDWREYDLPVYPILVLSYKTSAVVPDVPLEIGFPNKRVLEFDFDVIDLSKLDAEHYVQMANPAALALAARMKTTPHRRIHLARDFFLTLAATGLKKEDKQLIAGFFSRYQPLTTQGALQLEKELSIVKPESAREEIMQLTNPFIELGKLRGRQEGFQEGVERGRRQGIVEGKAELVLKLLARRLGPLPTSQQKAVRKLSSAKIESLGAALLDFTSPADLDLWLRAAKPQKQ